MKSNIFIEGESKEIFLKTTEKLIDKINKEIPMLKISITDVPEAKSANDISYHMVSVPLLLRLSILDVCTLFKLYLESNSDNQQNLLLRLLCGQLYEFTEDVPELFGKKYRLILSNFPNSSTLTESLNKNVIKEFNILKNRHSDFLKLIRHNVSHHRDIDALWQYYLITEIDFNWAINAYIDFVQWYVSEYSEFELTLINIAMKNEKE